MSELDSTEPRVEYRGVPGFDGYKIGNDGTVLSMLKPENGILWRQKSPIRKRCGYLIVHLRKNKTSHYKLIHRLVLEVFLGPCPENAECCHANGVRTDNRLSNLRWGTPKENGQDKVAHGNSMKGSLNNASRLTEEEVVNIRREHREGASAYSLGRKYGVSKTNISRIVKRVIWNHL